MLYCVIKVILKFGRQESGVMFVSLIASAIQHISKGLVCSVLVYETHVPFLASKTIAVYLAFGRIKIKYCFHLVFCCL